MTREIQEIATPHDGDIYYPIQAHTQVPLPPSTPGTGSTDGPAAVLNVEGIDPDPPLMIPGPAGAAGAPGGGGGSATTVETDIGSTPKAQGKFTITDAGIAPTSKVLCWQAPGPYTGKGTRADEAEMQPVSVIAVEPGSGSAVVKWQTPPMIILRPRAQHGSQPVTAVIPGLKDPDAIAGGSALRIGRVKGNVRFSYLVFA